MYTIEVIRTVPRRVLFKTSHDNLRYRATRAKAPNAPVPAASEGVATPRKITMVTRKTIINKGRIYQRLAILSEREI
jgi:hypothetical protein